MPSRFLLYFALLLSTSIQAEETPYKLAARYLCFGCHAVDEVRVGPSFQQVAERYRQQKNVVSYLYQELKDGSTGKWGTTPMPAEIAPEADLKKILHWIMQQ